MVMVEAVEHRRGACLDDACREKQCRAAEVGADFEEWAESRTRGTGRSSFEREPFGQREEAGGRGRQRSELLGPGVLLVAHRMGDQAARNSAHVDSISASVSLRALSPP